MSTFAFLLVCVQACLVQYASGQCIGSAMGAALAPGFLAPRYALSVIPTYAPAVPAAIAPGAYGGEGVGDIAIAGRMPVAGTTAVAGQVPILGSVRFGGDVVAGGSVTITGHCGCGGRYY